jgi:hypothetical protein
MLSRPREGGVINIAVEPKVVSRAGERVKVTLSSPRPILGFLVATVLPDGTKVGKWELSAAVRVPATCEDQTNTDTITHNAKLPWETFSVNLTFIAPLDALDGESYTVRVITIHGTEEDATQLVGEFANNTQVITTALVATTTQPPVTVTRNSTVTGTAAPSLNAFSLALLVAMIAGFLFAL